MYPKGAMPTSSTLRDTASKTSKGGTIAPAGRVSIFTLPPDIFSTDSPHCWNSRCKLAAAGCEDWPLRSNGCSAVWAVTGPGAADNRLAVTKASPNESPFRISPVLPRLAVWSA